MSVSVCVWGAGGGGGYRSLNFYLINEAGYTRVLASNKLMKLALQESRFLLN